MHLKSLQLYTQNLAGQIAFYTEVLGLRPLEQSDRMVSYQLGATVLRFLQVLDRCTPYHYAINIPSNKTTQALEWLKPRLEKQNNGVLTNDGLEVVDFSAWNAEAIYFYDADRNIVEFIARKNLDNESVGEFTAGDFLEVSEIGVPLNAIETGCRSLFQIEGVHVFDGSFDRFCAIGDEQGLFICIDTNKKDWFPTGDTAYASPFKVEVISQKKRFVCVFEGGKLQVEELS